MICHTSKELLAEIKKYMDLNNIQMKDLSISTGKSQQSITQIFKVGNPKCNTLFQICDALDIQLNIEFVGNTKGDT